MYLRKSFSGISPFWGIPGTPGIAIGSGRIGMFASGMKTASLQNHATSARITVSVIELPEVDRTPRYLDVVKVQLLVGGPQGRRVGLDQQRPASARP